MENKLSSYMCKYCGRIAKTTNGFPPLKTKCYKSPSKLHVWIKNSGK
jgi:hypothetical protein